MEKRADELITGWNRAPKRSRKRNVPQEVDDIAQEVLLSLFQSDGKTLRSWDPARGMSLDRFVGMLAQHLTISILRNGRTSPWRDEPTEPEKLDELDVWDLTPEAVTISRQNLQVLLDRMRAALSPRGLILFQRIVVDPASLSVIRYTPRRSFVLAMNTNSGSLAHLAKPQELPEEKLGGGAGPTVPTP